MAINLEFRAGPGALARIRDGGLKPDDVRVVAGAAGGPKWLVLGGLDRAIFTSFLKKRKTPLYLAGSSIGAWRFAAVAQKDPAGAIDRLETAYINQKYTAKPSPEEVTRESYRIFDAYVGEKGVREILSHPFMRLNIFSVRSRGLASRDGRLPLSAGLAGAALANLASRKGLRLFFQRTLFFDPRDLPPFYGMNDFPVQHVPFTEDNFRRALMAAGSIPLVMSGVREIPGAAPGTYRDGGLIDYHMDIPYGVDGGVVLYPHYLGRIVPGWFDKPLKGRRPRPEHIKNVLLISPSREFVARLPLGKIPDRDDFYLFRGRDGERFATWQKVVQESAPLGREFLEAVETGSISGLVKPL